MYIRILILMTVIYTVPVIDKFLKFQLFSQLSAVSSCTKVIHENSFECGERCGGALAGTKLLTSMYDAKTDNAGFIAYVPYINSIVISFRGTESVRNAIADVDTFQSPLDFENYEFLEGAYEKLVINGVRVHAGFEKSYASLRQDALINLKRFAEEYPTAEISFTGHSLGGAIANLAAFDFSLDNNQKYDDRVSVYTMGQPRVGNDKYDEEYSKLSFYEKYFRLVQQGDPITQVPFRSMGFVHNGLPIEISGNNELRYCSVDGPGGERDTCIYSFNEMNGLNHSMYTGYFNFAELYCKE